MEATWSSGHRHLLPTHSANVAAVARFSLAHWSFISHAPPTLKATIGKNRRKLLNSSKID